MLGVGQSPPASLWEVVKDEREVWLAEPDRCKWCFPSSQWVSRDSVLLIDLCIDFRFRGMSALGACRSTGSAVSHCDPSASLVGCYQLLCADPVLSLVVASAGCVMKTQQ